MNIRQAPQPRPLFGLSIADWNALATRHVWILVLCVSLYPSIALMPKKSIILDGGLMLCVLGLAILTRMGPIILLLPLALVGFQAGASAYSGRLLDQYIFRALATTNRVEIAAYAESIGLLRMLGLAGGAVLLIALLWSVSRMRRRHAAQMLLSGTVLIALFSATFFAQASRLPSVADARFYSFFLTGTERVLQAFFYPYFVYPKQYSPIRALAVDATAPRSAILVILGESASRSRMGLYGYGRQTTPSLQDADVVFTDLLSVGLNTIPNVHAMFTGSVVADHEKAEQDIFRLARQAGYRTFYIDNNKFVNDDPTYKLASQVDRYVSLNGVGETNFSTDQKILHDERVFAPFDAILKEHPGAGKIVFVQLMGSHFPHEKRYPDSFNTFPSSYDNSILYSDFIIAGLKKRFMAAHADQPALALYVADHGVKLPPGCGLGPVPVPEQALYANDERYFTNMDVPLLLWANDRFKQGQGALIEKAQARRAAPLDQRFLFWSVAELIGVAAVNGVPTAGLSIFSPSAQFLPRRNAHGEDIDEKLRSGAICRP